MRLMNDTLSDLRQSIDNLDSAMIYLLAERFRITARIGVYKSQHHLDPTDEDRVTAHLKEIKQLAQDIGLDPAFAAKVLHLIIDEVVKNHQALQ
jgi:chorismate mutase